MMTWQAIQTLSNREERVAEELKRLSVERYLPMYREKRRWSDREQWVSVPVFGGYVFAQVPDDDGDCGSVCTLVQSGPTSPWPKRKQVPEPLAPRFLRQQILEISGCVGIVGMVSEAEIDAVRKMMANGARPLDPLDKMRHLPRGQSVCVRCGPLTGISGVLLRYKGKEHLVVSLAMIHGAVATEINIRDVQVLELKKAA